MKRMAWRGKNCLQSITAAKYCFNLIQSQNIFLLVVDVVDNTKELCLSNLKLRFNCYQMVLCVYIELYGKAAYILNSIAARTSAVHLSYFCQWLGLYFSTITRISEYKWKCQDKLRSIHNSAHKIIALDKETVVKMETLGQIRKKRVSLDSFRPLNDARPLLLRNMLKRHAPEKNTRENGSRLSG